MVWELYAAEAFLSKLWCNLYICLLGHCYFIVCDRLPPVSENYSSIGGCPSPTPHLSLPLSLTNPILACAITKKFLLPLISSSQTIAHMISNNRMQTQFVFRDGFDVLMHYIGMVLMVMVRSLDVLMLFRLLNWMSWCLMH